MAERIFTIFEGTSHPSFPADEGDVKYHQGAIGTHKTKNGKEIKVHLSSNPSHLEFVNPVVEGMARARQDELRNGQQKTREEVIDKVLPVLMHGDAAFAGQGIVMETLQLANLTGYRTGGTIHIVINNQIGFTTSPEASRSVNLFDRCGADHANADFSHQRRRSRSRLPRRQDRARLSAGI